MDHLPLEILHSIFIKLDLKDRLNCMLICHAWHDVLDRHSLLYDLIMSDSQYVRMRDMLERLPYRANQVEILTFRTENSADFDKRRLCNVFPNLREIELKTTSNDSTPDYFMNRQFQFTNQTSKLEKIIDYSDCEVTRQLAISNLCSKLKSLTLTSDLSPNSKRIISQLIKMPVLEYLELIHFTVELKELELLHENVPSIQSIFFNAVSLNTCEIPRDVKPATLVTKLGLNIGTAQNRQAHIEFYLYLGKKYPLVDTFNPIFDLITEEDSDYARDVYNGGILFFYQTIGPRIDTFEFDAYCDGLDAFKKFDDSGMKLKELIIWSSYTKIPFFGELAQSQQAKYLERLVVNDMWIDDLEKMNRMEALESLMIDCQASDGCFDDDHQIDFSQLIEACPARLSTVVAHFAPIICMEPTSNLTSITSLELNRLELTPTLAKCLETSFPKLSTLYLQGTVSTPVTISLSKHHLEVVDISIKGRKSSDLSTVTSCIDGIQHYALKKSIRRYPETLLFKYDEKSSQPSETSSEDSIILAFICASVKEFCLYVRDY